MKIKKYLYIFLSLIYMDLVFNLFAYDSYLRTSIINIFLFTIINSFIILLITSIFNKKVNKIMTYIVYIFLWFWYSLYYIFYKIFVTPFSIALFRQSDQTLKFGKNIIISILQNIHIVLLFLLPVILLIIYNKKIKYNRYKIKDILIYICLFIVSIGIYICNIFIQDKGVGSTYNLYFETNNVSLNIERLGVPAATYLDIYRSMFGFDEKIDVVEEPIFSTKEELFEYDYNNTSIDFSGGSGEIAKINNFMSNEKGSKQNKYTGMFEGKNLIFIVAESFSEIAVSEDLTPTLYKLVHEGFDFKNFYTSNNLSTIGGEFQALTGLYADNTILSSWRGGKSYYPYGLPLEYINILSDYKRDSLIEANSNNLIIYNSKMKSEKIDKVGMSIDVIPTVYNLFGIEYDSRLIMGKDILSTSEGIAIFKDKSWITNKGTYYASTGTFEAKTQDISDNYVDTINSIVSNRVAISRMIVENNYYKYIFNK